MITAVYARVLLLATLGLLACATSASAFAAVLEGYEVYEDGTRDRVNVGGRCSPQAGRLVCHFISVSISKRPDRCSLLVSEWSETLTRVSSAQADEEHWAATKGPEGLWGALATTTLTVKRILVGSTRTISELTQRTSYANPSALSAVTGGGSLSPSVMHLKAALGLRAPADCRPDQFTVLPEDR